MGVRILVLLLVVAGPAPVVAQEVVAAPVQGTLIRRFGDLNWRSTFELHAPAFSRDGKTLAFAGTWHIGLWHTASGALLSTYERSGCGYFWSLAWAPDGSLYAAGQLSQVMHWDPKIPKLLREYAWHNAVVRRISLSEDGSRLASLDAYPKVAIWEMPKGRVLRTFTLSRTATRPDAVLSSDGKWLAATGTRDEPVVLYEIGSGEKKRVFNDGANHNFLRLTFTPDSKRLIAGARSEIFVWNIETGKLLHRLPNVDSEHVEGLAVSPDAQFVAVVGWGEAVHVWNLRSGRVHRSLPAPGDRLDGVTFSPDSSLVVAGGKNHTIHRWRVDTGTWLSPSSGHAGSVEGAVWLSPDRLLTAGLDRTLRSWKVDTGEQQIVRLSDALFPKAFSADRKICLAWSEDRLHLVETRTGTVKQHVERRVDWNAQLDLSPEGSWFAYPSRSKELHLCSTGKANAPRVLDGPGRLLFAVAFSPDGKHLAAGFEQRHKDPSKPVDARSAPPPPVRFMEPTIVLYDVESGKQIRRFGEELASVVRLAFSPDGRYLAAGDLDKHVHVWDLRLGKKLPGSIKHYGSPTCLTFSPDGRWLLTLARTSGTGFEMSEVATMTPSMRFLGNAVQTAVVAFAPDGRRVASGGRDSMVLLWDITGLAPQGKLLTLELSDADIQAAWRSLGEPQSARAHLALWRLVAAGDRSTAFLKPHLRPIAHFDAKKVATWIEQLDHAQFAVRREAMKQLEALGEAVEYDLRQALAKKTPLEMQQRLESLVDKLGPTAERLRQRRALAVLEQIGTAAARDLLEHVAAGEPRDSFTADAQDSLARLKKKQ